MIRTTGNALLVALVAVVALTQVHCGGDDDACIEIVAPDFQSGRFYDAERPGGPIRFEFSEGDESLTITLEDGTVEVLTRNGPIRRVDGSS